MKEDRCKKSLAEHIDKGFFVSDKIALFYTIH
jgi:hypothetical protein